MIDQTQADRLSSRVIEAVAAEQDRDPIALSPLYEVIDPDALDQLFQNGHGPGSVAFVYEQHHVMITSDGDVQLAPAHEEPAMSEL